MKEQSPKLYESTQDHIPNVSYTIVERGLNGHGSAGQLLAGKRFMGFICHSSAAG